MNKFTELNLYFKAAEPSKSVKLLLKSASPLVDKKTYHAVRQHLVFRQYNQSLTTN
jgi:hypothetical protein